MAACLRSLRLGVPCMVPGGKGTARNMVNTTRRSGIQTAATLHHTTTTPATLHHQYQHHKVEVVEVEGTNARWNDSVLPLHSFDPLGFTPCPQTQTLDDIEIQCAAKNPNPHNNNNNNEDNNNSNNNNICTFRLPPNALWYPNNSKTENGAIVCSLTYSPIEAQVITTTTTHPHQTLDMGVFIKSMGVQDGEMQKCTSASSPSSSSPSGKEGKPSAEQLSNVFNTLAEMLPKIFVQPQDYKIYSQDIVFENRIRGTRTVGLFPYVRQVALLRTVGHLRFAHVKFDILKITKHQEEGSVKVRWRINGLSGTKAIFKFWKFKLWDWKSVEDQMVNWYDGFSTFYVGGDGLVHTHIADSMMPDEEHKLVNKESLTAKMATLLGLVHRPSRSGSLNTTATTTAATTTATTATTVESLRQDMDWCRELMLPLEKIH